MQQRQEKVTFTLFPHASFLFLFAFCICHPILLIITKISTLLRKSDIDALTRLTNHRHKLLFSHNPTPDTSMTYIQNSLDTNESSKNKPMVIWLLVFKKFSCIAAWYNIFAVKLTPVAFCMTEPKNRKEDKLQIERTCFYFSWLHVSHSVI